MVSSKSNFHMTFQRRIFFDLGSISYEGQCTAPQKLDRKNLTFGVFLL